MRREMLLDRKVGPNPQKGKGDGKGNPRPDKGQGRGKGKDKNKDKKKEGEAWSSQRRSLSFSPGLRSLGGRPLQALGARHEPQWKSWVSFGSFYPMFHRQCGRVHCCFDRPRDASLGRSSTTERSWLPIHPLVLDRIRVLDPVMREALKAVIVCLNYLSMGGRQNRRELPSPTASISDAQLKMIERLSERIEDLASEGRMTSPCLEAVDLLEKARFDYGGEPVLAMQDLEAQKVIQVWPRVGECAVQPVTRFLSPDLAEMIDMIEDPRNVLLPQWQWLDRPTKSRVRASQAEWDLIVAAAHQRGMMKPVFKEHVFREWKRADSPALHIQLHSHEPVPEPHRRRRQILAVPWATYPARAGVRPELPHRQRGLYLLLQPLHIAWFLAALHVLWEGCWWISVRPWKRSWSLPLNEGGADGVDQRSFCDPVSGEDTCVHWDTHSREHGSD